MGDKWEIEKLDGSFWPRWKFQMKHLLMAKEVWNHVEGTVEHPEEAEAQDEYERRKQKAMTTIVMKIHTIVLSIW